MCFGCFTKKNPVAVWPVQLNMTFEKYLVIAFFMLVSTGKMSLQVSQIPVTVGKVQSKTDSSLVKEDQVRKHLKQVHGHKQVHDT